MSIWQRTVALFRAARTALHIAYGLSLAVIYPRLNAQLRRRILQRWSTGLLEIFNVKVFLADDDPLRGVRSGLIVTNHISWLDIFVLNAIVPMRFVAKAEVRRWPLIGWLCARAQTLFLERGKARDAARLNVHLVQLLQQGECLAIFPEGTTTDGAQVAHFHSSLLQPAIDAGAQVHPTAIRYEDTCGNRSTAAAYINECSFGTSLWRLLNTPQLQVRLLATTPLAAATFERRKLTRRARAQIIAALPDTESHNFHFALTSAQYADANLLPSTQLGAE